MSVHVNFCVSKGAKAWMVAEGPAYKPGNGRRFVTLTFDDAAPAPVPDETLIVSGTYRPTREKRCCRFDGNAPAPPAPHGAALSVFDGTDPNGAWNLFVFDDGVGDQGAISGGWSLEISTAV